MPISHQWKEYAIICDPSDVKTFLNGAETGFGLKEDLKKSKIFAFDDLSLTLAAELAKGAVRKKACVPILGSLDGICLVKIRFAFEGHGKRSGCRAYVIVIPQLKKGILVGITNHGKGVDNITETQKKKLKEILKRISSDLNERNVGT